MRPILLIITFTFLLSCDNQADFYYGTWELNKKDGVSTLTVSHDNKLTLDFMGVRVDDFLDFNSIRISPNKYDLLSGQGNECMNFTFERINENQCIVCNYKCWIDENMIDEVFVARKNRHPIEPIQKPSKEIIVLPQNYEGDFFIVYQDLDNYQTKEIIIPNNGIGINPSKPELKQLFNANRVFKFENDNKPLPIINPTDYTQRSNTKLESLLKTGESYIIQEGFNQSGRDYWNKEQNQNIKDNLNIEYFTIRRIK